MQNRNSLNPSSPPPPRPQGPATLVSVSLDLIPPGPYTGDRRGARPFPASSAEPSRFFPLELASECPSSEGGSVVHGLNGPHCVCPSSIDGHLGCFHLLTICFSACFPLHRVVGNTVRGMYLSKKHEHLNYVPFCVRNHTEVHTHAHRPRHPGPGRGQAAPPWLEGKG